jgi:phosphoribosylaminoimidazole-succinocarboxamide synthase
MLEDASARDRFERWVRGGLCDGHVESVPQPHTKATRARSMTTTTPTRTDEAEVRRRIAEELPRASAGVRGVEPAHRGKVRDVYARGDELLLVASDRVSAFDVVLGTIPLKGELLTEQATWWLARAAALGPTHLIERVDPAALRCRRAEALPVELVVRGYLAGSLAREPATTRGRAYGLSLDPQQRPFTAFASPIITPTTKEAVGVHDQPCSLDELVASGRVRRHHLERVCEFALGLFALGQAVADDNGLMLVDTKYEFGLIDGEIAVIDEVHTADSSRFWVKESYAARLSAGEPPEMLDKENLRRWLLAQGYAGQGTPPALTDQIRSDVSAHYWSLTERVLGRRVEPQGADAERQRRLVESFLGPLG